jgi:hypothetical protein
MAGFGARFAIPIHKIIQGIGSSQHNEDVGLVYGERGRSAINCQDSRSMDELSVRSDATTGNLVVTACDRGDGVGILLVHIQAIDATIAKNVSTIGTL